MFGKSYVINLDSRPDRMAAVRKQFDHLGLDVNRFPAHTGTVPYLAFNSSQYHCIELAVKEAKEANSHYFTIYEDDVVFQGYGHIHDALDEIPCHFDLLYLGANLIGSDVVQFKPPVRYSEHLFRLFDCWQSHAIVYRVEAAEKILANWIHYDGYCYDEWLRANFLKDNLCLIIAPQICYQAPGKSDIWGVNADYSSCFEAGNRLLV